MTIEVIELTDMGGDKMLLFLGHIVSIEQHEGERVFVVYGSDSDDYYEIQESYEQVRNLLPGVISANSSQASSQEEAKQENNQEETSNIS